VAIWDRLTTLIAGGALSRSAGTALDAAFETTRQQARGARAVRVLDPGIAAELRARQPEGDTDGIDLQGVNLEDDAQRGALGKNRFDLLTELARTQPGIAELFALRRRGIGSDDKVGITAKQFREYLRRHAYTAATITKLEHLLLERLDPAQVAAAIHRGLIPDVGLLQGEQPEPPFNVPAYPVYPIDADAEAWARGTDHNRLGVMVGLQGLPMGVIEAAHAYFRKIITYGDYIRSFNTSNNRNEWAKSVLDYARQIPTARDFFENALRGYHSLAWAQEQAERHGMSHEDSLVIYQNQGRPMNIRQITQALSRGGEFHPEPGEITDPYRASVVEGSVKPGYYDLALSLKYTLPSPFVMRQLTASGVWTEKKAAQRLKDIGWIPEDADEAAKAWATPTTGGAQPWTAKAATHLWTTTHTSYKAGEIDEATARANLVEVGVPSAERDAVMHLWTAELLTIRQQLSIKDLKEIYQKPVLNLATGNLWTRDEVLTAVVNRGYSLNDATALIETWNA
jgi:hypothetical protein